MIDVNIMTGRLTLYITLNEKNRNRIRLRA